MQIFFIADYRYLPVTEADFANGNPKLNISEMRDQRMLKNLLLTINSLNYHNQQQYMLDLRMHSPTLKHIQLTKK